MIKLLWRILTLKIRIRQRRKVREDLFVITENMPGRYQIDDISNRGLSFHYADNGSTPKRGIYQLKVVSLKESLSLQLSGKTLFDIETGFLISQNTRIMRRSILFMHMDDNQKKAVHHIIKEYTTR